jgi:hypothetical protein
LVNCPLSLSIFKENAMTRYFGCAAVALALVAGTANAQTVIERQITAEPVETIIERGPTGTVITRRPLDARVPGAATRLPADTFVTEPAEPQVELRETTGVSAASVGPPEAAASARRVTVRRTAAEATPRPARAASKPAVRKTTAQRAPIAQRTAVRTAPVATPSVPLLTAAQRSRIYQTVIRERVVPRTFITERVVTPGPIPIITPPVVRERVVEQVVADPEADPFTTERVVTAPPLRETFGAAPIVPVPAERVVTTQAAIDLTIGSRVPATVPIYALPETLARQIPAARPYRYVMVDDRVLLVDPVTNIIVAELDQ